MQMLPGHTAERLRVGQSVETSPRRPHDHRALVRIAEQMRRDCGVTPEELDPGRPARKPRVATTHARDIARGFDGASCARWAFSGTETVKEWVGIVDPLRIGMGRRVGSARIVVERSRLCRSDSGIHWIKERQASVTPEPFFVPWPEATEGRVGVDDRQENTSSTWRKSVWRRRPTRSGLVCLQTRYGQTNGERGHWTGFGTLTRSQDTFLAHASGSCDQD